MVLYSLSKFIKFVNLIKSFLKFLIRLFLLTGQLSVLITTDYCCTDRRTVLLLETFYMFSRSNPQVIYIIYNLLHVTVCAGSVLPHLTDMHDACWIDYWTLCCCRKYRIAQKTGWPLRDSHSARLVVAFTVHCITAFTQSCLICSANDVWNTMQRKLGVSCCI